MRKETKSIGPENVQNNTFMRDIIYERLAPCLHKQTINQIDRQNNIQINFYCLQEGLGFLESKYVYQSICLFV